MRRVVVAVGVLILATAGAAAPIGSLETRTITGTGSLAKTSATDIYLLQGSYHHHLVGTLDCYTTASLFPARGAAAVALADVLHADVSVGRRSSGDTGPVPTGTVEITQPGWARLEVGTGPDCPWTYSIRGAFLAEGDEPATESDRDFSWLLLVGTAIVASLAVLALRRRSPSELEETEPQIRVMDPTDD